MSLHLDEAVNVFHSQKPLYDLLAFNAQDPSPPLHNILIGAWGKVFGVGVFSIRGFSVIFSTGSVLLLFLFARKFLSLQAGVYASLLLSVSNIHLYYSHDARGYPLVLLLTVASFYAYLQVLEKPHWSSFLVLFRPFTRLGFLPLVIPMKY